MSFLYGLVNIVMLAIVTVPVNLAVSLAKKCQLNVGLLDADVYGPSVPMMMKLHGKPDSSLGDSLTVRCNKCFSICSEP